jgi:hypothetical protein
MARIEPSIHLSASDDGDPIAVANGGGEIAIHQVPETYTDRVDAHIAYPSTGSGNATVSVQIDGVDALSITMEPGDVYHYGPVGVTGDKGVGSTKQVGVTSTGGDTDLAVTGIIYRGGGAAGTVN